MDVNYVMSGSEQYTGLFAGNVITGSRQIHASVDMYTVEK